jgi:Uncharacterized conserved protein
MKFKIYTTLVLFVLLATGLKAQVKYSIKSQKVEIVGTSNLHDWTATIGKLTGSSDFKVDGASLQLISAYVDIDANSFSGSKGSIMDGKIKDTFDSEKFPRIKFALTKVISSQTAGNVTTLTVVGNLNVRNVNYPVEFVLKATALANGDIEVRSSKKLKMTDLGLKPPTAMLGTLKTANDVTINIYFLLKK